MAHSRLKSLGGGGALKQLVGQSDNAMVVLLQIEFLDVSHVKCNKVGCCPEEVDCDCAIDISDVMSS